MPTLSIGDQTVQVREATLDELIDLRHAVLRQGLPRDAAIFPGDELPTSLHIGAFADHRAVCCATFHLSEYDGQPAYRLRGMATDPKFRSMGIGRSVLGLAENLLRDRSPIRQLWCDARTPASRFYQSLGWQIVSEEYFIPTAGPHFRMAKKL